MNPFKAEMWKGKRCAAAITLISLTKAGLGEVERK
jgi:hypothetical protein